MATRFYLINGSVADYVPSTIKGAWTTAPSPPAIPLKLTKSGSAITTRSVTGTVTHPDNVLVLRAISDQLQAQSIGGFAQVILGNAIGDALARHYWAAHIYVTQGDTDLVRGTLLNNYLENAPNNWGTTPLARSFVTDVALANVNALNGDRVVVEIGYVARTVAQLSRGVTTGRVKASGPTSSIQLTFPTPPAVGSGIVVMMSGQKDSAGMTFGTCTDNRGNTYSVAVPQRRIATNGEYAVITYYCPKVLTSSGPFTITITGTGSDCCFEGCAVEVTGLSGGSLSVAAISSNSPVTPSTAVTTNNTGTISGEAFIAAHFARFNPTSGITVGVLSPPWSQEYEELSGTWLTDIAGEGDTRVDTFTSVSAIANWTMAVSGNYAAAIAAFTRVGATADPNSFNASGTIYYGAPSGSSDLSLGDSGVGVVAGSINFEQVILIGTSFPSRVAHVIPQVARIPPGAPSWIGHTIIQIARTQPPAPSLVGHSILQIARTPGVGASTLSHIIIQVVPTVVPALADMSGLYFLNASKPFHHDSYYNVIELKIPDPTIKTALLGE